jgi:hypothetical protein
MSSACEPCERVGPRLGLDIALLLVKNVLYDKYLWYGGGKCSRNIVPN